MGVSSCQDLVYMSERLKELLIFSTTITMFFVVGSAIIGVEEYLLEQTILLFIIIVGWYAIFID